ncbi:MAG: hypothetical protein WC763_02140 [Candidatus Paceibacterota bacterium]|jgi:hypothetical protein
MTQKKASHSHNGAIVAGLAGLTAAAVGAYYLYGSKNAPKNREQVKGWMLKAKGEVLERLEGAQEVTETTYLSAIDTVAKKYNALKQIEPAELASFISGMKSHWVGIKKSVKKAVGKTKVAKASPKKAPIAKGKK